MRTKFLALGVLLAAVAVVAAVAAAAPASGKQRVQIESKGSNGDSFESFVLTPMSTGATQPDKGKIAYCCWTTRHVVSAGETLDVNDPHATLTGANGTLRLRNRITWVDLPQGWSIFTGTWKVVGGTGAYAGLTGHGRVVGATPPSGSGRVQYFGFLTSK
jgi:hypothetical protein